MTTSERPLAGTLSVLGARRPLLVRLLLYGGTALTCGLVVYIALHQGKHLEREMSSLFASGGLGGRPNFVVDNLGHPLPHLLLQVIVILVAARLCGALCVRLGQPSVIGEMVAGIALGPSLFGTLSPALSSFLFDAPSLATLKVLSDIGAILFLFLVGLEFNMGQFRERMHTAVVVSHVSIVVPYALGVVLSLFLYQDVAPPSVAFLPFALFIGVAMSVTAFPVLARILSERRLAGTSLGNTAIACAAIDDVTAWTMLAAVIALVRSHDLTASALTAVLAITFTILMTRGIRPLLASHRACAIFGRPDGGIPIAPVLVLLFASALTTEVIGIHALFGGFLAGAILPRQARLRTALVGRLEDVTGAFLLPIFFAFSGLRTEIHLLYDATGLVMCLAIVLVATAGKLGAATIAARCTSLDWIDSFRLGALMNTRGLMELVALNVGYDLGVLSPRIFAMMVLMALITTFATGPLLTLADHLRKRPVIVIGSSIVK